MNQVRFDQFKVHLRIPCDQKHVAYLKIHSDIMYGKKLYWISSWFREILLEKFRVYWGGGSNFDDVSLIVWNYVINIACVMWTH